MQVLRETKVLLGELVTGNLDGAFKVNKDSLKLPIMPSNVNVLINVLKDVLYALETNTNTALLALLVHCFSSTVSPVDSLINHFTEGPNGTCSCVEKGVEIQDCFLIKDFDLYNERLLQIGTFAVSCSSDENSKYLPTCNNEIVETAEVPLVIFSQITTWDLYLGAGVFRCKVTCN